MIGMLGERFCNAKPLAHGGVDFLKRVFEMVIGDGGYGIKVVTFINGKVSGGFDERFNICARKPGCIFQNRFKVQFRRYGLVFEGFLKKVGSGNLIGRRDEERSVKSSRSFEGWIY